MEKRNTVEVDSQMVVQAVKKARAENIATTMKGLFSYLLYQAKNGTLSLDFGAEVLSWEKDKVTSIVFDEADMEAIKGKIKSHGFKPVSSFVVNLLISNYLNK